MGNAWRAGQNCRFPRKARSKYGNQEDGIELQMMASDKSWSCDGLAETACFMGDQINHSERQDTVSIDVLQEGSLLQEADVGLAECPGRKGYSQISKINYAPQKSQISTFPRENEVRVEVKDGKSHESQVCDAPTNERKTTPSNFNGVATLTGEGNFQRRRKKSASKHRRKKQTPYTEKYFLGKYPDLDQAQGSEKYTSALYAERKDHSLSLVGHQSPACTQADFRYRDALIFSNMLPGTNTYALFVRRYLRTVHAQRIMSGIRNHVLSRSVEGYFRMATHRSSVQAVVEPMRHFMERRLVAVSPGVRQFYSGNKTLISKETSFTVRRNDPVPAVGYYENFENETFTCRLALENRLIICELRSWGETATFQVSFQAEGFFQDRTVYLARRIMSQLPQMQPQRIMGSDTNTEVILPTSCEIPISSGGEEFYTSLNVSPSAHNSFTLSVKCAKKTEMLKKHHQTKICDYSEGSAAISKTETGNTFFAERCDYFQRGKFKYSTARRLHTRNAKSSIVGEIPRPKQCSVVENLACGHPRSPVQVYSPRKVSEKLACVKSHMKDLELPETGQEVRNDDTNHRIWQLRLDTSSRVHEQLHNARSGDDDVPGQMCRFSKSTQQTKEQQHSKLSGLCAKEIGDTHWCHRQEETSGICKIKCSAEITETKAALPTLIPCRENGNRTMDFPESEHKMQCAPAEESKEVPQFSYGKTEFISDFDRAHASEISSQPDVAYLMRVTSKNLHCDKKKFSRMRRFFRRLRKSLNCWRSCCVCGQKYHRSADQDSGPTLAY